MTSWPGEYTDEYFAQPAPDPGQFGMPATDDGSRSHHAGFLGPESGYPGQPEAFARRLREVLGDS
jgi:hypothetical protein